MLLQRVGVFRVQPGISEVLLFWLSFMKSFPDEIKIKICLRKNRKKL
jgi:hypothetical protein